MYQLLTYIKSSLLLLNCSHPKPSTWWYSCGSWQSFGDGLIYLGSKAWFYLKLKVRKSRNDFFKPTFPPKNERTNSTLLLWNLRSTCARSFFGGNWRHQKDISKLFDLYQKTSLPDNKHLSRPLKRSSRVRCQFYYNYVCSNQVLSTKNVEISAFVHFFQHWLIGVCLSVCQNVIWDTLPVCFTECPVSKGGREENSGGNLKWPGLKETFF